LVVMTATGVAPAAELTAADRAAVCVVGVLANDALPNPTDPHPASSTRLTHSTATSGQVSVTTRDYYCGCCCLLLAGAVVLGRQERWL
jgi:hypothetical protein